LEKTWILRPDLLEKRELSPEEEEILDKIKKKGTNYGPDAFS
jgi:hypothetical protein